MPKKRNRLAYFSENWETIWILKKSWPLNAVANHHTRVHAIHSVLDFCEKLGLEPDFEEETDPKGYHFSGTQTDQVRQIGNAVPCGFARALLTAHLTQNSTLSLTKAA